MTRKQKIILIFTIIAIAVSTAYGCINLYGQGYAKGAETSEAEKTGIRQYLCLHKWNKENGKCSKCGLSCPHTDIGEDSKCRTCGYRHFHEYENGICRSCVRICEHKEWKNGICEECGIKCGHEKWANNTCLQCGTVCRHFRYEEGICEVCGYVCPHKEWKAGVCSECGMVCGHRDHDVKTGICTECGIKTYHEYKDGICSCGSRPQFIEEILPENILGDCKKQGRIETVSYVSRKYNGDQSEIIKTMDIYLPWGYSEENEYNVLLLIHGGQGTYSEWTSNRITVEGMMSSPKNIYDNMIEQKLCRPLIIAGISTYYMTEEGEIDSGFNQMTQEIRNDILPYIISHYKTYSEGISESEISNAREHFGIGGVSNGALYAFSCGMKENNDLFANYACFGGCAEPDDYMKGLRTEQNKKERNILYIGTGSNDRQRKNCYKGFRTLTEKSNMLTENVNAFYGEVQGGGHDWRSWSNGIFNALLVMFNCEWRKTFSTSQRSPLISPEESAMARRLDK